MIGLFGAVPNLPINPAMVSQCHDNGKYYGN